MSRLAIIFKIALPSASPDILSGMRLSLTVALILSVVCEILAGLDGLGHWVLLSARSFRSADLFAGVILLGVIGYADGACDVVRREAAVGLAIERPLNADSHHSGSAAARRKPNCRGFYPARE